MNESQVQALVLSYAMEEKNHHISAPNITGMYRWEMDVVSATKALRVHEFEIKVTRSDFRADKNKRSKHDVLKRAYEGENKREPRNTYERRLVSVGGVLPKLRTPNYFWYVIEGFNLSADEVPPYAGLLRVATRAEAREGVCTPYYAALDYRLLLIKDAPRLHRDKMTPRTVDKMAHWLSYKLKNSYVDNLKRTLQDA